MQENSPFTLLTNTDITMILLSRYRYICLIKEMQLKEFEDLIYYIKKEIYPAFLNKSKPIPDIYIKNIICDYINIINSTLIKMKNEVLKAEKNNDSSAAMIKKYRSIIMLKYINKKSISSVNIEKKLCISSSHLSRDEKKAIAMFTEYMLPIAHRKGYSNATIDLRTILKLIASANNAIIKHNQAAF